MNGKEHLLLGSVIGGSGYVLYRLAEKKPINMLELILYSIGGSIAGILPDILESATNPNHRSLFHSITTLIMIAQCNNSIWDGSNQTLSKDQKAAISILSAAAAAIMPIPVNLATLRTTCVSFFMIEVDAFQESFACFNA